MDTYIFEGEEVVLTGRTASKNIGSGSPSKLLQRPMVEITPFDKDNGTWKKWTIMGTLFKVDAIVGSTKVRSD